MKTKQLFHIMVFGMITSDSNVIPLFIFPPDLRLKLEEVVLCWIKWVASSRVCIRQQDPVPCPTSRRTKSWLSENFCDHITLNIWPPNSPDCNPHDYYV